MKPIKKFFIFANILLFIATIMSYIAPYVNPTKAWIFPFFATAYFWLLISNLLAIIMWILFKNKLWMLSFLAILLGLQHVGSYIMLSVNQSNENSLSVLSYNVGGYSSSPSKNTRQPYKKEFSQFIEQHNKPSILCLQESGYSKFYRDSLGYKNHQRKGGLFILTDYEIKDEGVIDFEETTNAVVWADLLVDGAILRVVNMHLQSNKVSEQAEDLVSNPDLGEKKTWIGMKSVVSKIKRATKMRTTQALETKKFIDASPFPTIVVGDFNDTPLSYTYRQLAHKYKDAFIKKGNGFGFTYAGVIPALRIDYILGSKDVDFKSYTRPKLDLSDHYPIISHFEFERNPSH